MKHTMILGGLASVTLWAQTCIYEASTPKVNWEAYKTPLKIGVKGTFDNVAMKTDAAATLTKLLLNTSVRIDVDSVDSGNAGRDTKLRNAFFGKMEAKGIAATVKAVSFDKNDPTTGILDLAVTMNGQTRNVPMRFSAYDDRVEASGVLDLFDFHANDALKSINQACFALHKGKTWSDVTIRFTLPIRKRCE